MTILVLTPNTPQTFTVNVTGANQLPLMLGGGLVVATSDGLTPNAPGALTLTPNT